jgi:hypothetical protein
MSEFLCLVDNDKKEYFEEIMEEAVKFGFVPKKDKVKHFGISFLSKDCNATVLRVIKDKRIELRLKFFASKLYSSVFDESIKRTIERFDYKYTGCYGCGKCTDQKEGYIVRYPDNVQYFRCGNELIEIINIDKEIADEIKVLIKNQHNYYMMKNGRKLTTAST